MKRNPGKGPVDMSNQVTKKLNPEEFKKHVVPKISRRLSYLNNGCSNPEKFIREINEELARSQRSFKPLSDNSGSAEWAELSTKLAEL